MWTYQILSTIMIIAPVVVLNLLIDWIAGLGGDAVTTANIKQFLLSWRFPVILALGALLVLVYIAFELMGQVHLTSCILSGQSSGTWRCIKAGTRSLRRFMNPGGVGTILFILLAVPICGVGLSISLSSTFYIPHFIMETLLKNPLYAAGYIALLGFLIWTAYRSVFVLHAVILDGMTPKEGKKHSARIVMEHKWEFIKGLIKTGLVMLLIMTVSWLLFSRIPELLLGNMGEGLPKHYRADVVNVFKEGRALSEEQLRVCMYRIVASFSVMAEKYLMSVVMLLCGAYFMLRLNRWYLVFTGREQTLWPERPKKARYRWKVILILLVFLLFAIVSFFSGMLFEDLFYREDAVRIVAHRTGGTLASENSLEGIEKAVEHGCYGAETDIQRTKDGCYIINHDDDFRRLTGVAKAPKDMTMDEIRQLRIKDTTGNGQELAVPTLEEMLDAVKGRIRLFVELKGKTADHRMADDVVRIIKEHDCVEDTVLISLNYDVINYAETHYPEFETGTLFFASLGDVSRLNCDLLIMEEETATNSRISAIHRAQKQAVVWTVNTEQAMHHFLDSEIDAVITDRIGMAEEVQAQLDDRTDLEILEDKFG